MTDTRPLSERVRLIARRFDAIAIGLRKQVARIAQDFENYEREAAWLHAAADKLKETERD